MRKTAKTVSYCALTGFVLLIYTVLYLISEKVEYKYLGNNYNMVSYVLMLALIAAFVGLLLFVSFRRERKHLGELNASDRDNRLDRILAVGMLVCGVVFLYLVYCHENMIYPAGSGGGHLRSMISRPVYAVLMCCLFAIFVLLAGNGKEKSSSVRLLAVVFFALLCAAKTYAPNPFINSEHETNHMHAYVNSIINIANLHPFDWNTASVYGHYGLIYLPLVKLLGNNYTAVALSIAVFAFISYYCAFSVCRDWIKKDSVFFLSILGISGIPFMIYGGEYFQVNPRRLLFPAVTLFLMSKIVRKEIHGFRMWTLESIVGALAVIWNLETGLFSVAVLCAFNLATLLRDSVKGKTIIRLLGKDIAFAVVSFAGAYLLINLYSFLTGASGWMSPIRFIYPINSLVSLPGEQSIYKITDLRTGFVTPFSVYVVQLVIFSIVLLNAGHAILSKDASREYKNSRVFLFGTALSGFSAVIYFVNRAAYANLSITWIQMMIVLGIYGAEGFQEWRKAKDRKESIPFCCRISGKMIMLLYVFVFAVEGFMGFEPYMKSQVSTYWNTVSLEEAVSQGSQHIPEDVLAIGHGVPELFFQLGRNDYPSLIDWSDLDTRNYQKALDLVDESINNGQPILLGNARDEIEEKILQSGYQTTWEHTAGAITFKLMEPEKAD